MFDRQISLRAKTTWSPVVATLAESEPKASAGVPSGIDDSAPRSKVVQARSLHPRPRSPSRAPEARSVRSIPAGSIPSKRAENA